MSSRSFTAFESFFFFPQGVYSVWTLNVAHPWTRLTLGRLAMHFRDLYKWFRRLPWGCVSSIGTIGTLRRSGPRTALAMTCLTLMGRVWACLKSVASSDCKT